MTLEQLKDSLPEYAKDIKLNISSILLGTETGGLNMQQLAGTALASAYATKEPTVIAALQNYASQHLDAAGIDAAKAAATIMAMNNIYYRATHLANDKDYGNMPAKLRMNIMANPGIPKIDFELSSLAVSAITGCGMCIDSHMQTLQKHGVEKEAIQNSLRIAAVVNAAAQAMQIEKAL